MANRIGIMANQLTTKRRYFTTFEEKTYLHPLIDDNLIDKIDLSFKVFDDTFNLIKSDNKNNYQVHLAFSGGKDSHILLAIYLLWTKVTNNKLPLSVVFADTLLENRLIYKLLEQIKLLCLDNNIKFIQAINNKSYWFYQFAYGYAVPDYRIRWCTTELKINPMKRLKEKKHILITFTGRHYGESVTRDIRLDKLNQCGSNECGVNKIKKSKEPILHWRNCDVWDGLFFLEDYLYPNAFNTIQETYINHTDIITGSLRLGCVMCPVKSVNKVKKEEGLSILNIRLLLEELRKCHRISAPPLKNSLDTRRGAIYKPDRIIIWEKIKPLLLMEKLITNEDIQKIDKELARHGYPITYPKDWIKSEEEKIKKLKANNILFDVHLLPLFKTFYN
jgi:3'-phosphoadenosine 5'-phosphosulfate sulfotransferase (PAPS reductase)/FAD synthetase